MTKKHRNNINMKEKNPRKIEKLIHKIILLIILGFSFLFDKLFVNIIIAIQQPLLLKFFYTITLLGEIYIFILIALILTAALIIYRRPITAFWLTLAASAIIEVILKTIINRPRPFVAMHLQNVIVTEMSSFPSGHTMMFFSIIPIMSKNFPKLKIILWTIAILVGFSRVYLGVHYFSDIVWGAFLGYGIGWICMKIGEKYG